MTIAFFGIGHWELLLILICLSVPVVIGLVVVFALSATRQSPPPATNIAPCPDCGQLVSRLAPTCPHCGRPLKQA